MRLQNLWGKLGSFFLGGVNGLLFGSVVELLRRTYTPIYLERFIQREIAASPTGSIGYVFSCIGDDLPVVISEIPLACMVVFAVVSLLVHTFWKERPRFILLLWQIVGIVSMTAAVALHNAEPSPCHHVYLLSLHWRWVLCLPLVAGINLLYGLFIATSVDFYSRWKNVERFR